MVGRSIIGYSAGSIAGAAFPAINATTGEPLPWSFATATAADLDRAVALAVEAFAEYRRADGKSKARFLRAIAERLEAAAPSLIERAGAETALPVARLQGETARTCNQLRLFADLVQEGSWVQAHLDLALNRENGPRKPDLRSMLRPLGPVAIFGASNFPLAFSVAGGDTASALAAGNPVVVKAHPAHPGTSELAGQAISEAARSSGLPEGVFSMLYESGIEIGTALVRHAGIRAVGFTGSLRAGRALMDLAAARPEPIPVYAEMGSSNPVFILPRALAERGDKIVAALHASVTLGAGQFCTKPGVILLPAGAPGESFASALAELITRSPVFTLLTAGIAKAYAAGASERRGHEAIQPLAHASGAPGSGQTAAWLFQTDAGSFLAHADLEEELFGPATLLVRHGGTRDLLEIAHRLHGHLTATIHATDDDLREHAELLEVLQTKAGRVIVNGFPTGVEVTHAMVHGGPYPATSDGRSTSVGTQAIFRFARPVCYQDVPDFALPAELKNANPFGIWRQLDGAWSRDAVSY